jgi:hypothetical protein
MPGSTAQQARVALAEQEDRSVRMKNMDEQGEPQP